MIGGELLPSVIVTAEPDIYITIWFDWSSHINVYNTSFSYLSTHILNFLIYRKECEELEADERTIDSKIKKKQEELDRTEKRLRSLENVRPQFMDEVRKHTGLWRRFYTLLFSLLLIYMKPDTALPT